MVIAGEASGDALASELVAGLRERNPLPEPPAFFGIGGPRMAAAGVEVVFDFARNAVFGAEALLRILHFRRRFQESLKMAIERQPDAIVCVDFAGFNRRFARAVRAHLASNRKSAWSPRIIQFVSPQVWASRPGRAAKLARDIDLLLAIFPFERAWYRDHVPQMRVEFVGHPVVDRFAGSAPLDFDRTMHVPPRLVIFPGSRPSELKRHLPILRETLALIRRQKTISVTMVLGQSLVEQAKAIGLPAEVDLRPTEDLPTVLAEADIAIAKSGTITLECAVFGVPTVAMYKTSWATYEIARRIVSVKWIAMPNILANEEVFPEFVQEAATPQKIAEAILELINNPARRNYVKSKLKEIVATLGERGAALRAAEAIWRLMGPAKDEAVRNHGSPGKPILR